MKGDRFWCPLAGALGYQAFRHSTFDEAFLKVIVIVLTMLTWFAIWWVLDRVEIRWKPKRPSAGGAS